MDVIRCDIKNLEFALNSVNIVKKEFDDLKENISEDAMIKFLNDDKNYLIAAIDDGRTIGFVLSYELQRIDCDSKMMLLYEITVLKDYRKKGIGTILINYLKQICENENFMKMWVPTEHSNLSAVALYKKTGAKMSEMNDEVLFTWYSPFIDN